MYNDKKQTILIVDDTETNIDILVDLLVDYDLLVALDGESALEISEEEKIDLILLDIMMPIMNGYEVCKKLKQNNKTKDIPVIFITANIDESSIEKAYDSGGIDYITKPFKPKELLSRVSTHLDLYHKSQSLNEKIRHINDSINYATHIQHSLLPDISTIQSNFNDSFIIWEPRNKVGGDLYIYEECSDGVLFGVVDCTGHGVAGGFMTMLVGSIIKRLKDDTISNNPALILKNLNISIKTQLKQDISNDKCTSDNGVDMGLCFIDNKKQKLIFSGAKIDLIHIRENQLNIIKSDKQSIGYKKSKIEFDYTNFEIELKKDDIFYIYSDGIKDQTGGERGFSFGNKNLLSLLENIHKSLFEEQRKNILDTIKIYQNTNIRKDDITIIGFKIN